MSKYSNEFKLQVVKYCLNENHGCMDAARHFNMKGKYSVAKWVRKYQEHGVKGLKKNNQHYDGKFKQNVVKYMHKNHLSLMETCVKFNIGNPTIVGKWERMYYEKGPRALYEERRGKRKNMSLKLRKKKLTEYNEKDLISEVQ